MQRKDDAWHNSQESDKRESDLESIQVPPTLLPDVLNRLGLTSEPKPSSLAVDDVLIKVKSEDWEVRTTALSTLEKLTGHAYVDVFVSALDDEDGTVRAVALRVLGDMGRRTPLPCLMAALHDPDWHVRETAVFALGKQKPRVPYDVLLTVLHDSDASVKEAARLVLQWNYADEEAFPSNRSLWEKKSMHDQLFNTNRSKSMNNPSEAPSAENWHGAFIEYNRDSSVPQYVKEQAQVYAERGYAPQNDALHDRAPYDESEYNGTTSSYGEKITSYRLRGKRHKGLWALVPIVALLFLMVGRFTTLIVPQSSILPGAKSQVPTNVMIKPGLPPPSALSSVPFANPAFTGIITRDLAAGLHLSADQLVIEVDHKHRSLVAVAATQGVSAAQLNMLELQGTRDAIDTAVKQGAVSSRDAVQLIVQVQEDTGLREKIVQKSLDIYDQYTLW